MDFMKYLLTNRFLLWELTKKDMKAKYLGSVLGVVWAFIHPLITIVIYWVVFQLGFKNLPIGDIPFILWLLTGMVPWLFFSESFSSATNSILENTYLVKKVVFRISVLPLIKIVTSMIVHMFFIFILFLMFFLYHYEITIYTIQIIYYLIATVFLVLGLSLITSSLVVFAKDFGQIIGVIIQFLFWLTPIFWNLNIVPVQYQIYFKLNPVFYLVEGYRDSFIYHKWFWEHSLLTPYFWIFTILVLVLGIKMFKKLKPHFADVL